MQAALATSPKALTIAVADAVAGSPTEPMAAGHSCDAWLDGAIVLKEGRSGVGLVSAMVEEPEGGRCAPASSA